MTTGGEGGWLRQTLSDFGNICGLIKTGKSYEKINDQSNNGSFKWVLKTWEQIIGLQNSNQPLGALN